MQCTVQSTKRSVDGKSSTKTPEHLKWDNLAIYPATSVLASGHLSRTFARTVIPAPGLVCCKGSASGGSLFGDALRHYLERKVTTSTEKPRRRKSKHHAIPTFSMTRISIASRKKTFFSRCRCCVLLIGVFGAIACAINFAWQLRSTSAADFSFSPGHFHLWPSLPAASPGSFVILVAVENGSIGNSALQEWNSFAVAWASNAITKWGSDDLDDVLGGSKPRVRILCYDPMCNVTVHGMSHLEPLVANPGTPWHVVLEDLIRSSSFARAIGLCGEGALPSDSLLESLDSLVDTLSKEERATGVVGRSRGRKRGEIWPNEIDHESDGGGPEEHGEHAWLRDDFLAQLWGNRRSLSPARMAEAGLADVSSRDTLLLEVIQRLAVGKPLASTPSRKTFEDGATLVLVDGTDFLRPSFAVQNYVARAEEVRAKTRSKITQPPPPPPEPASASAARYGYSPITWGSEDYQPYDVEIGIVHIGSLGYALMPFGSGLTTDESRRGGSRLFSGGAGKGRRVSGLAVEPAPWPPRYVLEEVASPDGLVIVTSVNCGYLDMATNFLTSVRKTSTAKVMFVAMDDVSFDFLDGLDPGCAVRLRGEVWERRRAVRAGAWGDYIFKMETTVRPEILLSILNQGYAVLWTDVDIVWLGSPLPLLPDPRKEKEAEIMLQNDNKSYNKCTCFIFMRPTPNTKELMVRWKDMMESREVYQNQRGCPKLTWPAYAVVVGESRMMDQVSFQTPLLEMVRSGLRVRILPPETMPPGILFFNETYMEMNRERYEGKVLMVHNNWVIGHYTKLHRFIDYGLWYVGHETFPECTDGGFGFLQRRLEYVDERDDRHEGCSLYVPEED